MWRIPSSSHGPANPQFRSTMTLTDIAEPTNPEVSPNVTTIDTSSNALSPRKVRSKWLGDLEGSTRNRTTSIFSPAAIDRYHRCGRRPKSANRWWPTYRIRAMSRGVGEAGDVGAPDSTRGNQADEVRVTDF